MFASLKAAKVNDVYRRAALLLKERGMSVNMVYDPYSGSVDAYGAILLACGAKVDNLANDDVDPTTCGVPDGNIKPIILAVEYFEAMSGLDISDWGKSNGVARTVEFLNGLADRIDISVVSDRHFRS